MFPQYVPVWCTVVGSYIESTLFPYRELRRIQILDVGQILCQNYLFKVVLTLGRGIKFLLCFSTSVYFNASELLKQFKQTVSTKFKGKFN